MKKFRLEKINTILKGLKSKSGKVLIVNFFSLSIIEVVAKLSPWITLPYVTYVIGLEKFGLVTFADAFSTYFLTIVDYGFAFTGTKEIAQNRDDRSKLYYVYNKIFTSKIILLVLSLLIYLIIIFIIPSFSKEKLLYLYSFIIVIANVFSPKYLFQGVEKMKYIAYFDISAQVLKIILIFIFINDIGDYVLMPLFTGIGALLMGFLSMWYIYKEFQMFPKLILSKEPLIEIKKGFSVFANQLLPNLYNNTSTLLLGIWFNNASVGVYGAAQKLINSGVPLLNVLSRVFFPRIANSLDNFHQYKKIVLGSSILLFACYFIFSDLFFKIVFTEEFYGGVYYTYIMTFGILGLGAYNCFGINWLIQIDRAKDLMYVTLIVSLMGFAGAFVLVKNYGELGAAINVTLTRILMGVGAFLAYRYYKTRHVLK